MSNCHFLVVKKGEFLNTVVSYGHSMATHIKKGSLKRAKKLTHPEHVILDVMYSFPFLFELEKPKCPIHCKILYYKHFTGKLTLVSSTYPLLAKYK